MSAAHAGRPRVVGALLLAVPLGMGLALSFLPSYDARSPYFVQSYSRIVDAGDRYLVALILFGVLAAIITISPWPCHVRRFGLKRRSCGRSSRGWLWLRSGSA